MIAAIVFALSSVRWRPLDRSGRSCDGDPVKAASGPDQPGLLALLGELSCLVADSVLVGIPVGPCRSTLSLAPDRSLVSAVGVISPSSRTGTQADCPPVSGHDVIAHAQTATRFRSVGDGGPQTGGMTSHPAGRCSPWVLAQRGEAPVVPWAVAVAVRPVSRRASGPVAKPDVDGLNKASAKTVPSRSIGTLGEMRGAGDIRDSSFGPEARFAGPTTVNKSAKTGLCWVARDVARRGDCPANHYFPPRLVTRLKIVVSPVRVRVSPFFFIHSRPSDGGSTPSGCRICARSSSRPGRRCLAHISRGSARRSPRRGRVPPRRSWALPQGVSMRLRSTGVHPCRARTRG